MVQSTVAKADTAAPRPPTGGLPSSPPARPTGRRFSFPYRTVSWVAPLFLLTVWEVAARAGLISPQVLPAPSTVLETATRLTATGELPEHLGVSLLRALSGFAIGAVLGLIFGVLVGFSRVAEAFLDRSLQMIRAVPFLAVLPLVIVWFGVGETGKIFLIVLGTTFPLYLNTVLGIRQVAPNLIEMSGVVGLNRFERITWVILPGALPSILNGVRQSMTTAWLALVIAETIGAAAGVGFLATNAREFLQVDVIVMVVLIYALIGIVADLIARLLERRLLRWHPTYAELAA